MSDQVILHAKSREAKGKGASRRLRKSGQVPAIIYGAGQEPRMISIDHNKLLKYELDDSFFSSILKIDIDGGDTENVLIRDYHRDPVKPKILHLDFLRVNMKEKLSTTVPVHFVGDENAPGIIEGGSLQRLVSELDIMCLPDDLPEFIEIDVSELTIGSSIRMAEVKAPEGVEIYAQVQMAEADAEQSDEMNLGLVSIAAPTVEVEEESASEVEAEGETAAADADKKDDE